LTQPTDATQFVTDYDAWLRTQTISSLLSKDELLGLSKELHDDDAFWETHRPRFDEVWAQGDTRLRAEDRPLRELIGKTGSERVVAAAESLDPDPEAVRTFLRSPAIETMLGAILYQGITEFLKKADLIGRVVNKLPVLGGIRRKVMGIFADEIEKHLESQIKSFLGGFSGLAVERMISFVLSEENRQGMAKARARLADHILDRPVKTLIPDSADSLRTRDRVWDGLREAQIKEDKLLDGLYADHGEERLGAWLVELIPGSRAALARPLDRFYASEVGKRYAPS
jgi:hypothetical protein